MEKGFYVTFPIKLTSLKTKIGTSILSTKNIKGDY
jgi:hypothetical protein